MLLQTKQYILLAIWLLCAIFLFSTIKSFLVTNLLFGFGFFVYLYGSSHWIGDGLPRELHILLNRLSLVFVLLPLFLFSKQPFIKFWRKPQWDAFVSFPFIWSGFHQAKVKWFLPIALAINIASFTPFLIQKESSFYQEIWVLALLFSVTNAVLEEFIWRGALLHTFSEQFGDKWAVVMTSLGFGLQHYSLGIPLGLCLAFSIGGFFYGGITIKSSSIVPSIIWHFVLNLLMVCSGLLF